MGDYADYAFERGLNDFIDYENHRDDPEDLIENGFGDYDGSVVNPYEEG